MLAVSLPPILSRFMNWAEANPAMGVVSVLVMIVVLLWLVRKSIKFFMVVCLLLVVTILGSYFFYGKDKTNKVVREGVQQIQEDGKELRDKLLEENGDKPEEEGDGE